MSAVWPLVVKEFRHILRDRRSLIAALALPVLMLLVFGYAIILDVTNVQVAVIDRDQSPASRQLLSSLAADGTVVVASRPRNEAELQRLLDLGRVRMGIVIPPGYGERLAAGEDSPLQVLVDGTEASFAAQALAHVTRNIRFQTLRELHEKLHQLKGVDQLPSLSSEPRVYFNESLDSRWFVVPGLIAAILMQLAAMVTSQCIAREYEQNTIEQLLVSPVSGAALMVGKLLPYLAVGVVQVTLVTLAARLLFHVPFRGSLLLFAGTTVLYLTAAMTLGLLVSAALKSQQLAMQASLLISILPSFLLSGFIFPISNMPRWLQLLSYAVPARYFIAILRGIFLKGAGLAVLWPEIAAMAAFATILLLAAISRFRSSLS